MHPTTLQLPTHEAKPRKVGLTMMIDSGLPTAQFTDTVESFGEYVDVVKFGWGTCLVTDDLAVKIAVLREHGIDFYFGGTLFEKFVSQGKFDEWRAFCDGFGARSVEVSNGTIDLPDDVKTQYVARLSGDYRVFSEVGLKDATKSEAMDARQWIDCIRCDLAAGADYVITEARESGKSGICSTDGELKLDLIEYILASGVAIDHLLFEAPNKTLQTWFVTHVGPNVNLGNIAPGDVVPLETLRLGLRGDTLLPLTPPNASVDLSRMAAADA